MCISLHISAYNYIKGVFCCGTLTHWGRVTHICVGKLTIIGSDNGLSPERRQAIIWTNAGILIIGPLRTNFSEILSEIHTFSLKKIRLKMSSAKYCSFRLGLNVLRVEFTHTLLTVNKHGPIKRIHPSLDIRCILYIMLISKCWSNKKKHLMCIFDWTINFCQYFSTVWT